MKYKSEKTLRRAKKAFSLIELMIVIVIIGALTAIILPQFDISEAEAKDAGCDASNYGTLAQLTKFRSLHGVFPSRMHTGLEKNEASANIMGYSNYDTSATTYNSAIPSFTAANMSGTGSEILALDSETTESESTYDDGEGNNYTDYASDNNSAADSLREAGIIALAYGGFPKDLDSVASAEGATFNAVQSATLNISNASGNSTSNGSVTTSDETYVISIVNNWYEEWNIDASTGKSTTELNANSTPISINNVPLPFYRYEDPIMAFAANASSAYKDDISGYTRDGIVVPLFIAPTTDWDHWYDSNGSENEAKIGVAQTGACPWLEANAEFRYYIAVFKAYYDGSKAKLLGTMCPEGGSLNP